MALRYYFFVEVINNRRQAKGNLCHMVQTQVCRLQQNVTLKSLDVNYKEKDKRKINR